MSFKYQRKTMRFAKGSGLAITHPLLGALALAGTSMAATAPGDLPVLDAMEAGALAGAAGKADMSDKATVGGFDATAITRLGQMWDVVARSAQCLDDNFLALNV